MPTLSKLSIADLKSMSRRALNEERSFDEVLDEGGLIGARYDAHLNDRPLIFQHIPKTAGASCIQALETYFDDVAICPASNPADFSALPRWCERPFQFYRGHFSASQFDVFPANADLFTILRDPVDWAFSMYEWVGRAEPPQSVAQREDQDWKINDSHRVNLSLAAASLAQNTPINEILWLESETAEMMFWSTFLRQLSRFVPAQKPKGWADYRASVKSNLTQNFESAMAHLATALTVGDYARLIPSLYTLCHFRGWPAPPPLPSIHRYVKRDIDIEVRANVEHAMRSRSPHEFKLYDYAVNRSRSDEERLLREAGDFQDIRDYLNERYREKFFTSAVPTFGFHLTADKAWGGCGWSQRERYISEIPLRTFAVGRSASLFVKLQAIASYLLLVEVFKADRYDDIATMSVAANGTVLRRTAINNLPRGSVQIALEIPESLINSDNGRVTLNFAVAKSVSEHSLMISSVRCQPSPY